LASLTAKYLVVDARTSQAVYTIADHLAHAGPLVQQFERWARQRLAEGFSLDFHPIPFRGDPAALDAV